MNLAQLGIRIDSGDAVEAKTSLDEMAKAGGRAEQSMAELERVLSKGAKTTQDLAKQRDALAKLTATAAYGEKELAKYAKDLDKSQLALAKSALEDQKALNSLLGAIDPSRKALATLDAQVDLLNKSFRDGKVDQATYAAGMKKFDQQYASLERTSTAFDKLNLGTRQAQENVVQLGNALSSGDWGSGARAITQIGVGAGASVSSMLALVAPVGLAAAAIGGLAYAYYSGSKETDAFNKSLILTGNYAGTSAGQLSDMARQVSSTVGTTGAAADILATLAGNGKLASGSFVEITEAALSMEQATGKSIDATIAEFVKIADDPVAAAKSLNDQYHFLTASVYSQIVALKDQGDEIGATKLLTDTYADTVQSRSRQVLENLSLWERAWRGIKIAANDAVDGLSNAGRQKTFTDQINELKSQLSGSEAFDVGGLRMNAKEVSPKVRAEIEGQIRFLELQRDADLSRIKFLDDQEKAQRAAVTSMEKVDALTKSSLSNEQKRNKELADYKGWLDDIRKADANDPRLNQATVDKNIANINDRYKDPKTGGGTSVDLTSFNDSKNALTGILSEYKNAQKELDAAQKAGLVSQADYLLKRQAMIGNERDEVTAAYEAEISALEATKGKAGTSAAQRIQLDQKIADARAAMVKAQKDADSELAVLALKEKERTDKQTLAVNTYTKALQQQVDTLRDQGRRAALGLGMGDRQRGLADQQNGIADRINQQKLDLANQYGDGSRGMSFDEYTKKVAALDKAQRDLQETAITNYDEMTAAQGSWSAGATSAWQNYLESARDVAGQTKSLITNTFSSAEDAVANFAINGKGSFSDFTKSVLADMARIAARQGASALLGSLVGAATSYFAPGAGNGFAAGSAGAVSSGLGASQAGYSGSYFPQALGGAWSEGAQMFANGGAFTNSIVSTPTAFGMAGGQSGVMGEAGPEAIMPLTRTSSGKLGVIAAGGGGSTTYNFPVEVSVQTTGADSRSVSQETSSQLGKSIQQATKAEIEAAIARALQPSGSIWRLMNGRP
ncbi:phage tail tape measure protein [Pseudomonas chlororaphis]|uniref:phage tail tape measure protein n=1 Tax=Pseudomonas chlororaphis TaxID=587753 RepID=UPI00041790DA|nr:phage tail tape measure protein [Pseudomonas chlororaphis]